MERQGPRSKWRGMTHAVATVVGAAVLSLLCFLVLPFLKAITEPRRADMELRDASTAVVPPPPDLPEPPKQEEKEPEEPKLDEPLQPLSLEQMELALDPNFGLGGEGGEIAINLAGLLKDAQGGGDLFDSSQLDEPPRPIYQPSPNVTAAMKKRMPATVYVLFTVDEHGRVENPIVKDSDDPIFEGPALAAIRQWKFEPGKHGGEPVSSRVRQPFVFK